MSDKQITKPEEVNKGDFVRFVDRDKQGRFSYVGEVMVVQPTKKNELGYLEILTFDGTMGFFHDEKKGFADELYATNSKPTGWFKFKKSPKAFAKANAPKPVAPAKTKRQQVMELVASNPRKKEAGLLTLAKKEIGGSEAQLVNYIKLALAKK